MGFSVFSQIIKNIYCVLLAEKISHPFCIEQAISPFCQQIKTFLTLHASQPGFLLLFDSSIEYCSKFRVPTIRSSLGFLFQEITHSLETSKIDMFKRR